MSTPQEPRSEQSSPEKPKPPGLTSLLPVLWAKRVAIIVTSVTVSVVTLIVSLLMPAYYLATASLLPETQKDKLSALSEFADIAQLAGVGVPGSEIARLYPTIVNSETILLSVINKKYHTARTGDSVDLVQYFGFREPTPEENSAKCLKRVRELLTAAYDNRTSVVTLSLEMPEPQLAADVLNEVVAELDKFMRGKKRTNASEQARWVSERLDEVAEELRSAENALKDFREKNRRLADSPELAMRQERLIREVQLRSTIFVELKKQYELARIEEIKNITIVNVLDYARAPVKRERPRRATNTVIMFVLTVLAMTGYHTLNVVYGQRVRALFVTLRTESKGYSR